VFLLREWVSQNARPGVFQDVDVPQQVDVPAPEPIAAADQPHDPQPDEPAPPPIGPRPETPPPPVEPIILPPPEPRRRAIHRQAFPRRVCRARMNGGPDRARDQLDDLDNLKHLARFKKRLSPIDSSSESDDEDAKSESTSSPIYSNSNATLKEAHEEARRRRDAVTSPKIIPEENVSATFSAESHTWNKISSTSSQDVFLPHPFPVSLPPTYMRRVRSTPNDPSPPRPSSLPSTPKYQAGSPGSRSQESFFPSTTPSSTLPTPGPSLPYPLILRRTTMPSSTIPSPQDIALSSPGLVRRVVRDGWVARLQAQT
jgi:hypothetical protein